MNKDLETKEYLDKIKGLKLSESSRSRIASNLLEYARFHPVRVEADNRFIEQVPQRTSLFNLFKTPKSMISAIVVIALLVGGGASYAAEGTVPGDFLYTMKTEVNENIKSAFAISSKAEARLQTNLLEERLKEAEELATRGELTAEVSSDISSHLKAHYDEAEEQNDTVEAEGDFESSAAVRASLEGSLRVYDEVLTNLNTSVSGNSGLSLINDIRTYADATAQAQTQATATVGASVDLQATAKSMIARTEAAISEVEVKLARAEAKVSADAYARMEVKFNEAVSTQAEAEASLQMEVYREAYSSAQTALRLVSEVDAMINSLLRLQVDVNIDTDSILDINLDTRTETTVETANGSSTETDGDSNDAGIEIESTNDSIIDTEVIKVEVESNTELRPGLNL